MAFNAKGQRFKALKQEEGVKRRDGSARVAQSTGANLRDKCSAFEIRIDKTVVLRVRCRESRVAAALCLIEVAFFDNYAAHGRSVTADEFCCRFNDDVCAVFERTIKIWRSKRVVNDQQKTV